MKLLLNFELEEERKKYSEFVIVIVLGRKKNASENS